MENGIRRPTITRSLRIEAGRWNAERDTTLLRPRSLFELELGRELLVVERADHSTIAQ